MNQSAPAWRIAMELPDGSCVAAFEEAIALDDAVVTAQEIAGSPGWRLTGYCTGQPDRASLDMRVAIAAASAAIDPPPIIIEEIPATDWVADYQSRTKPVTIGRFFIYPSHFHDSVPRGLTGMKLDAGLAFGTGEHESTAGCLVALQGLKDKGLNVGRGLDMGCGSAILAIAMARLWPDSVIVAVDNDPISVSTATENVADNGCAGAVSVAESDGYGGAVVQSGTPYDLITANILARPLIAMVPGAASALAVGGHAILSGILSEQAEEVLDSYVSAGFALSERLDFGSWATLVLERQR
jgi:ribosomal protein L11 methyltransferase